MDTANRLIASAAKHAALSTLGKTLRTARLQAGLTQQAAGEHLGVTGQTIRNWETGRNEPSQDSLQSLTSLYGLQPGDIKAQSTVIPGSDHRSRARQRLQVDPSVLVQARKEAGLSQADASLRSGIHITSIRRYERGSAKPTRAALHRLALIYGKPPPWLDSNCPNSIIVLDSSHMDPALRIYLEIQQDLTPASVQAIGEFIIKVHRNQQHSDRGGTTCPPAP